MGQFTVKIEELAQLHIRQHLKSGDRASIKKIEKIIIELSDTPYQGIGQPEPLNMNFPVFGQGELTPKIG